MEVCFQKGSRTFEVTTSWSGRSNVGSQITSQRPAPSLSRKESQMKKRIILAVIAILLTSTLVFGASLNLKATWTANTEPDMASYRLYRTDGARLLIGTILHPIVTYDFTVTVPDGSTGTLTFVLTAVDTNNNESGDSVAAPFAYNLDVIPPAAPRNPNIQRQ